MSEVTAALRIESILRTRILNGALPPGSRIDQGGIARELGVSRLPVRDALMTLVADGLVSTTPHRGAVVVEIDHHGLVELYELRMALEPGAAARAVPRLDDGSVGRMTTLVEMMESIADPLQWRDLNDEFHALLLARSGRARIIEIVETARARCGAVWLFDSACMEAARSDHRLILGAATRGDAVGVRLVMEAHLALGYGQSVQLSGAPAGPSGGRRSTSSTGTH